MLCYAVSKILAQQTLDHVQNVIIFIK